jgi:acid phosphatase
MIEVMKPLKKGALGALFFCFFACSSTPVNQVNTPSPLPSSVEVPLSDPTLLFFTFGDWGSGDGNQRAVAQALRNYCAGVLCDFGLLLGDNFYDSGVESVEDPLWNERFEQMYQGLDLSFYAVLGNHDHRGNPQAQIDYTYLPGQNRWKMPNRQFTIRFSEAGTIPLIEIFALDSTTFSTEDAAKLQEDINASQAQWKILAMHHPIYSNGSHGDTQYLIDFVLPIICQDVDLVLVGHDHLFTHLQDPNDGCGNHHLVVGTGGKAIYPSHPDSRVLFTLSDFGFASLNVSAQEVQIQFHKTDDTIPYEYTLQK